MGDSELKTEAANLAADYTDEEAQESWDGSVFAWIRTLPPRTKGAIGLRLAQAIFRFTGKDAQRVRSGLNVGAQRTVVRFSMEWTAGGLKFEQFKDDNYDFIFCLGVRPDAAYAWLIPKSEVLVDGVWQERANLTGQHRGDAATDTFWLSINPDNAPVWLRRYGGTIAVVESVIASSIR